MKLTKCSNNHYYNADKLPYCPHCIHIESSVPVEDVEGLDQQYVDTISVEDNAVCTLQERKTTGWLVCISGEMYGESFILYEGDNHIGRERNMNVCLAKEPTVSRNTHATITYNTEQNSFSLGIGASDKPVFHNNTLVTNTALLTSKDLIQLGDCQLLFIALCSNEFSW